MCAAANATRLPHDWDGARSSPAPVLNAVQQEQTMSDEEKIRAKAHEIWLAEGKPEGKEKEHWEMAIAALAKAAKPKKARRRKRRLPPKQKRLPHRRLRRSLLRQRNPPEAEGLHSAFALGLRSRVRHRRCRLRRCLSCAPPQIRRRWSACASGRVQGTGWSPGRMPGPECGSRS